MQRVAWILGLLVASPAVVGAELFRCIDAAGGVTWQDAPCGAGSRLSKTLEVPKATESDEATGASAKRKGAKSKRGESSGSSNRSSSGIAGSGKSNAAERDSRARQRESCKAARAANEPFSATLLRNQCDKNSTGSGGLRNRVAASPSANKGPSVCCR